MVHGLMKKRNSAKLRIPEALAIDIDIAYDNVAVDYHLFFFKGKSSHQMIHGPCSIANCQSNLYSEREREGEKEREIIWGLF